MTAGYELVPLDCPSCGAAVKADGEDVVYYCTACRNGYRFDLEAKALSPMEVAFVSLPNVSVELYRPFWLLPALGLGGDPANARMRIEGQAFVRRMRCLYCGHSGNTILRLTERLLARDRKCPRCGGERVHGAFDVVDEIDLSALSPACLGRTLDSAGFETGDIFTLVQPQGDPSHFELGGKR